MRFWRKYKPARWKDEEFKSDGCTLWPDLDYKDCCIEHDRLYFGGGFRSQKRQADLQLTKCVARKGKNAASRAAHRFVIAPLMLVGVTIGGAPSWPWRFRWGFGWEYSGRYEKQPEQLV